MLFHIIVLAGTVFHRMFIQIEKDGYKKKKDFNDYHNLQHK